MPYDSTVSDTERLIRCEITGNYDPLESITFFRELCASGRWPEGWPVLVDVRKRVGAPTPDGIARLVSCLEALRDQLNGRVAVVTGSAAQFGMVRMLETLTDNSGVPLRGFRDEGRAMEWLREEMKGVAEAG